MLAGGKDSRWLQLEVCREFQRQKCTRSDSECKFAHPKAHIELQDGKVIACYDSIKDRCNRETCKYFHPPPHLKEQLLINGKNHLAMKNAMLHQMQLPLAATNPTYLTNLPASAVAAIAPPNGASPLQSPAAQALSPATNGTHHNHHHQVPTSGSAAAAAAAAAVAAAAAQQMAATHPGASVAAQQQAVAAAVQQHQAQQQQMALLAAYGYPTAAASAPISSQMLPGLTAADLHSYEHLMSLSGHSPQLSLASPTIPTSVSAQTPLSIPSSTAATNPILSAAASFLPTYLTGTTVPVPKPIAPVRHTSSVKLEVCREHQRSTCKRSDNECRFAHPPSHVHTTQDGQSVVVCSNFIKSRCIRDQCRFFHPPSQLMDQVRNQLAAAQQQFIAAAAAAAAANHQQQQHQFLTQQQQMHQRAIAAATAAAAAATLTNHSLPTTVGNANYANLSKKRPRESDDLLLALPHIMPMTKRPTLDKTLAYFPTNVAFDHYHQHHPTLIMPTNPFITFNS